MRSYDREDEAMLCFKSVRSLFATVLLALLVQPAAPVYAAGLGGGGFSSGFGVGGAGVRGLGGGGFSKGLGVGGAGVTGLGGGTTIINDGMGGFTSYSIRGNSRFIGKAGEGAGGKIYNPGGGSSLVIPDGSGGAYIYGPGTVNRYYAPSTTAPSNPHVQ